MKIRAVATLEEAAKDLDAGKAFYDFNEEGIGLYFIDSLLSDIESLRILAGIHRKNMDSTECSPNDFHSLYTTISMETLHE